MFANIECTREGSVQVHGMTVSTGPDLIINEEMLSTAAEVCLFVNRCMPAMIIKSISRTSQLPIILALEQHLCRFRVVRVQPIAICLTK